MSMLKLPQYNLNTVMYSENNGNAIYKTSIKINRIGNMVTSNLNSTHRTYCNPWHPTNRGKWHKKHKTQNEGHALRRLTAALCAR